MLLNSKLLARGWTLQELIAPHAVTFYNSTWKTITEKQKSLFTVHKVTRISEYVLATGDTSNTRINVININVGLNIVKYENCIIINIDGLIF
jgi:hypothetical protein